MSPEGRRCSRVAACPAAGVPQGHYRRGRTCTFCARLRQRTRGASGPRRGPERGACVRGRRGLECPSDGHAVAVEQCDW
eukprot:3244045-Alexandrium_andersonii.AAC.1